MKDYILVKVPFEILKLKREMDPAFVGITKLPEGVFFLQLIYKLGLADIWRHKNGNSREYTYSSERHVFFKNRYHLDFKQSKGS